MYEEARFALEEVWACAFAELQTNGYTERAAHLLGSCKDLHLRAFDLAADATGRGAQVVPVQPRLMLVR